MIGDKEVETMYYYLQATSQDVIKDCWHFLSGEKLRMYMYLNRKLEEMRETCIMKLRITY